MKSDSLTYRLFRELPDGFFELFGRPASDAARYRFDAIELKDTAVLLDGFYAPTEPNDDEPVYFVEFQHRRSSHTYSNLLLKIGLYLEKVNPTQNRQAVVVYPNRAAEQANVRPYRAWLQSDQLTRIYVNELPEPRPGQFTLSILRLIAAAPSQVVTEARRLIPQVRALVEPREKQTHLIELIETIIGYQLPNLRREEIEKMLQVDSFRETRLFQDILQEGIEEGKQIGAEDIARRLLARKKPLDEIADITGLSLAQIKKLKKKPKR